jgi:hypothetical protein
VRASRLRSWVATLSRALDVLRGFGEDRPLGVPADPPAPEPK